MSYFQSTLFKNNQIENKVGKWNAGRKQQGAFLLGLLALACAAILFAIRVKVGLQLFRFVDETEKFVAAQMINHGLYLYRDIFAHHGPVPYMISHLYVKFVSSADFSQIRLSIAILAVAACFSIFFSPVLKSFAVRSWAVAMYLSVLSSVWALQGILFVVYQPIGGFLLVIVLAQMVIPALLGEKVSKSGVFISGISLTLACFSAYAFGPAAIFMVASTIFSLKASKENLKKYTKVLFAGIAFATAIVVLWLVLYADLLGFLVYHFYFNQYVYASFIGFSWRELMVGSFRISFLPENIVQTFALIIFVTWVSALAINSFKKTQNNRNAPLHKWAIILLAVAVLFVNPRGEGGFHSAGFVVVNFAVISLLAALLLQNQISKPSWGSTIFHIVSILLIIFIAEQVSNKASISGIFKKDFSASVIEHKPERNGIYDFVRSITKDNEQILSLIFDPTRYIKAGILPASGHFYYLPWQAAYSRVSVLGYNIDICRDIVVNRPTVIWFDDWKVWDKYAIKQYEPCVPEIIKNNYSRFKGDNTFFIRNDIAHELLLDKLSIGYRIRLSPPLLPGLPIKLSMMASEQANPAQLKRIGVLFRTYVRENPGEAELRLKGPDGAEFVKRFFLPDLADNKYRYFDLDLKRYTSGEILSISGGGVSTWESHSENSVSWSCISYEFSNGKRHFTPGCPFY